MNDWLAEESTHRRNSSLFGEMCLGAFWGVAGMFFVGPLAAVIFQWLQRAGEHLTLLEMLANGFWTVFLLVLRLPSFLILGPVGAAVAAVRWLKSHDADVSSRSQTIVSVLVADTLIATTVVVLALFVRA